MANRSVVGRIAKEGLEVTVFFDEAKKRGKNRIHVSMRQSGKAWQNTFVRTSKFQGLVRFESEKKSK